MKALTMALATLAIVMSAGLLHAETAEQTTCPVMEGSPVDRSIFSEYNGKQVYFCCKLCRQSFQNSPEKYISKLPQFSENVSADTHEHGEHAHGGNHKAGQDASDSGINLYVMVKPLGIATYSCLVITVLLGLFRRKLRRRFLSIHKVFAFLTLSLATVHATLIFLLH